jgi:hypothetical protein
MCDTGNQAEVRPAEALPAGVEWQGEVLRLEPVPRPVGRPARAQGLLPEGPYVSIRRTRRLRPDCRPVDLAPPKDSPRMPAQRRDRIS